MRRSFWRICAASGIPFLNGNGTFTGFVRILAGTPCAVVFFSYEDSTRRIDRSVYLPAICRIRAADASVERTKGGKADCG